MHNASSMFAAGPQSMEHRTTMVQASRGLLLAVTRLLIVADVADIYKLLNATSRVSVIACLSVSVCLCLRFCVCAHVHAPSVCLSVCLPICPRLSARRRDIA